MKRMHGYHLYTVGKEFEQALIAIKNGCIATRPVENWKCGKDYRYFVEIVVVQNGDRVEKMIRLGNSGEIDGFCPLLKFVPNMEDMLAHDWEIYERIGE